MAFLMEFGYKLNDTLFFAVACFTLLSILNLGGVRRLIFVEPSCFLFCNSRILSARPCSAGLTERVIPAQPYLS